jgi:glycerol kinase
MIGDQQSALFGHQCYESGKVKCTYGTGCFILVNTGERTVDSKQGLLSTVAWKIDGKINYALEGSIFMGGATMRWLRDEMKLFNDVSKTADMASESTDEELIVVPSFVGLGAPYWNNEVKGAIFGLKLCTSPSDIVKATLKGIAFQVKDVLNVVSEALNGNLTELLVDGGASNNGYLMQFESDILGIKILKTKEKEVTVLGAAYLAGLSTKFYASIDQIKQNQKIEKIYLPRTTLEERTKAYDNWGKAIKGVLNYVDCD